MKTLTTPSAGSRLHALFTPALLLLFFSVTACGYQTGSGAAHFNDVDSATAGRSIAIPLFENATFEPILEKRVTETFKETFYSRGWKVISDQNLASFVLTGRINRFERIPVSLNRDGQAQEFRVKIGMELRLLDSENGQKRSGKTDLLKRESEGVADYIARVDVAEDRVAEDRAIREAGRKMAEQVTDLLTAKNFFKTEPGAETAPEPASPAVP
jgi:outer membrane lipopolysaccharide assembly protein LptE/RlpB